MHSNSLIVVLFTLLLQLFNCEIYRLSRNVKPVRYILTMEPFLHENFYTGSVIIEIKILDSTNNITLHKNGFDLHAKDVKVTDSSEMELKVNQTWANEGAETYTIILENNLEKNQKYNLTINKFSRDFADSRGFFLTQVLEDSTERENRIALTHFEPTGARMAFPCFDEPGLKAKFIINIIRREGFQSLSNEALEKTEDLGEGRFKDTFQETPIMPTYVVAFVVANFNFTKTERHRVFAASGAIQSGKLDYALEVGVKTLKALEHFLEMNYTLSKMDQVAIPGFTVHGMENWGLVIYRDNYLVTTNNTNAESLQTLNCYIAHEFAHQWFGNLVTAEWWDYLWLSEALAAYFHYHIAAVVEPSWRLKEQFVIEMVHKSFQQDEIFGAAPLNFPITESGTYPPLYIMYQKGASIIRMTEHFLTHEVFKKGLQIYLQKHQFSSVIPSDLYNAFQQALDEAKLNHLLDGMTVSDILTTWDSTKFFLYVTVTRNYTSGSITIQQFAPLTRPRIVPINYVFSSKNNIDFINTTTDYWLKEEKVTRNDDFPTDGWLIVNKQETGYYRVKYDLENWNRIIDYLNSENFTSIHPLNRAQLIDDAFFFASKRHIPWSIPLRLCDYLIRERDFIPFAAFYNSLDNYVYIQNYPKQKRPFRYFEDYALPNTVIEKDNEYLVYKEYLRITLSGIAHYFESLDKSNLTHLDKLHSYTFKPYWSYAKDDSGNDD